MSLDQTSDFVQQQTTTSDAFLGGRITVRQPARGFRAGLDSVLLGASVPPSAQTLLDLGSGVGTAALVALAHAPALRATLAERDEAMLALAQDNAAVNGFAERVSYAHADVAGPGSARQGAGIEENAYETVIANPPFFDAAGGTLARVQGRAGARHMQNEQLELWVKSAAGAAAGGGEAIFIYPAQGLQALLAAFGRRFGALTILPLCARPDGPATRVLLRGIKGSRTPLTLLGARALHEAHGRAFRPEFEAIFRGEARLVW
ncbi:MULTISPECIES: methyltransferase [unclassified Devosia]|uniref:tRNA1(Val) (adenine(37)-N6)-methyltransferase n=1 Tax=unclassified Devosia TaxID=196773 RepID=UPI0015551D8C|nr:MULTISPECIES: methyltransferase [unclassified Devosia]